ncbi:hypothetical protein COOONC_08004 [Cooperia oncophora]
MKKCIEMHVTSLYEKIANVPSDELLNQYYSMWKIYYKGANYVHRLFGYLNNQFVKSKRSVEGDAVASYATFLQKPDVKEIGCVSALSFFIEVFVFKFYPSSHFFFFSWFTPILPKTCSTLPAVSFSL